MLWLAIHLPQLSLEALGNDNAFRVVTERRGARRWVVAAPQAAAAPGTDWGAVQVLRPELQAVERKVRAEREAMQALAAWACRYGSELVWEIAESGIDYGLPCAMLWIEIGASLRLFGGLSVLLADFDAAFADTGHCGSRGVAPTIEAASLLARTGALEPVIERAQLTTVLSTLPLSDLALPPATLEALSSVGLSRIDELLALPADALGRRHGPKLVDHLDRLLGRRPDVRARYRLPPKYQRRFDLLGDVEHSEGLLFPLQRMTRELAEYLRARDTGLQEFRLVLTHGRASGGKPQPDTVLELRLATSTRDADRLLRVLREQLARTPLPAPVRTLRLHAERFVDPAQGQGDLFDATRGDDEAWSQLIEKLVARLGSDAVTALGLIADHRPERCWQTRACDALMTTSTRTAMPPGHGVANPWVRDGRLAAAPAPTVPGTVSPLPPRPIWLIDPPKPLPNAPKQIGTAERIEGGWWDGGDVMRDYYHAELHGGRFWVYQDRRTDAWYLQGIWA